MNSENDRLIWRKSSYSGGNGGDCVEVALNIPGTTAIRDSKLGAASPVLTCTPATWAAFLHAIKTNNHN